MVGRPNSNVWRSGNFAFQDANDYRISARRDLIQAAGLRRIRLSTESHYNTPVEQNLSGKYFLHIKGSVNEEEMRILDNLLL